MNEKPIIEQMKSLVHLVSTTSCPKDTDGDGNCGLAYCPVCGVNGMTQAARKIREQLGKSRVGEVVQRPWGQYEVLWEGPSVLLKRLTVRAGEETSHQIHRKRDEIWFIQSGVGRSMLYGRDRDLVPGSFYTVFRDEAHNITATERDLVIYELQVGEPDENDLVRISDKYGRVQS